MGQTTNYNLPYPESTDPANVPADVRLLAESIDTKIKNIDDSIEEINEELIISEDITISVSAVANQYKYAQESITIPTGYKILSASIIDNGYVSQEIASIINLTNSRVVVNVYGANTTTVNVKVRILYIKDN